MAIPPQNELHRPVLELANELGRSLSRREAVNLLIDRLNITEVEQRERLPSGRLRFERYTYRARRNLKQAGLLHYPARGEFQITPEGSHFLSTHSGIITRADLKRMTDADGDAVLPVIEDIGPDEQMERSYREYQASLEEEVLDAVKDISPDDFERLVTRLLKQMGYGEISQEKGYSGDQGIDGILNQDALGLEKVYVQAKRYTDGQVSEPDIRNFSGSLTAKGATKGIFITTADFSAKARDQAKMISQGNQIIRLVDGPELAQLMIEHNVGLISETTYEIKKLDANYFAEV